MRAWWFAVALVVIGTCVVGCQGEQPVTRIGASSTVAGSRATTTGVAVQTLLDQIRGAGFVLTPAPEEAAVYEGLFGEAHADAFTTNGSDVVAVATSSAGPMLPPDFNGEPGESATAAVNFYLFSKDGCVAAYRANGRQGRQAAHRLFAVLGAPIQVVHFTESF